MKQKFFYLQNFAWINLSNLRELRSFPFFVEKEHCLPAVLNEGVVVSCVGLSTVNHNPDQLVVNLSVFGVVSRRHNLQDPLLLIGRFPGVRLGAAVHRLQHFFPPGHSVRGVGLHVQHPGKLQSNKTKHISLNIHQLLLG